MLKNKGHNKIEKGALATFIMLIAILLMVAVIFFSSTAHAVGASNGIKGSPHDFSGNVLFTNLTFEICRVCHIPHDNESTNQYYLNGLLWNHKVSSATYTMYNSTWSKSLDGQQSAQPDGTAKLCLGCHDGTVALDTFDKYAGGVDFMSDVNPNRIIPKFSDGANLDLRGTHPLSIKYDPVADPKLNPTNTVMGTSGTIADVLDNGKVQCSSCHDVHDQETVSGTQLLRVRNGGGGSSPSGLCLTCHIK